jgi:MFS transporter, DHA3 family, macrolide efflux protein
MTYRPPPHGFRTFVIVWLTQSLSVVGSAMTGFVLNIYLAEVLYPTPEQKPELALAFTALNLGYALPVIFGAPIAGAWADRRDRKRTMVVADATNFLICALLIVLMRENALRLWMLICIGIVSAIADAFHLAAFDTSYAMLVPDRQLPRANGMMHTMWSFSGVVSPALAATVLSLPALARQGTVPSSWLAAMTDGTSLAIGADALTFAISALVLCFLHVPSPKRSDVGASGKVETSIWTDIREGALYIWNRRPMLWLLGTFTVANFVVAPNAVITPLLVKFNLAPDWMARGLTYETALALIGAMSGLGGLAGGVLMSVWGGLKRRRVYGVLVPMICGGLAEIVFGLSPFLYLSAVAGFLSAATSPLLNAHSQTIWQTQTPRELQGRVFSVRRLIAQFTRPIGTALAGWLAGPFDPGYVLAVLGSLLAVFCVAQLFNPYLLRVEDKAWLDQLANDKR